jgi:hypothetical protein
MREVMHWATMEAVRPHYETQKVGMKGAALLRMMWLTSILQSLLQHPPQSLLSPG